MSLPHSSSHGSSASLGTPEPSRTPTSISLPGFTSPARVRRTPSRLGTPIRRTFDIQLGSASPRRNIFEALDDPFLVKESKGDPEAGHSIAARPSSSEPTENEPDRAELDRQLAELGVNGDDDSSSDEDIFDDAEENTIQGYDLRADSHNGGRLKRTRSFENHDESNRSPPGTGEDEAEVDNDADDLEFDIDDEENALIGSGRGGQGRRGRGRRKGARGNADGVEGDRGGRRGLLEIVPSMILSHPLALLPIVPLFPHAFSSSTDNATPTPSDPASAQTANPPPTLPALITILLFVLISALSVCVQIVTIYTARYLKVSVWEEVFGLGFIGGSGTAGRWKRRKGFGMGLIAGRGRRRITQDEISERPGQGSVAELEVGLAGLGFGGRDGWTANQDNTRLMVPGGRETDPPSAVNEDEEESAEDRRLRYGIWLGQGLQILGSVGVIIGWLSAVHPILHPILLQSTSSAFLTSRPLWTLLVSLTLLPQIIPQRHKLEHASRAKEALAILLPLVVLLVIGRTVEVMKAGGELADGDVSAGQGEAIITAREEASHPVKPITAGTAILSIILLFTPHMHTLPIHATVLRDSRSKYAFAWLGTTAMLLILALPYITVPYFLLKTNPSEDIDSTLSRAGVFDQFPPGVTDGWLNFARVCMVALLIASVSHWMSNAREICLRALGVEREGRAKAIRWLAGVMWAFVAIFAGIGGWPARKLEQIGFVCLMLTGWLIPAIVFIKVFHLSIPIAIVFPSAASISSTPAIPSFPAMAAPSEDIPLTSSTMDRNMDEDPALTALLARKERQLQKRRTGRRLWQDLIVMIGILPIGGFAVIWSCCLLFGFVR